jgi:hypothetical protein
MKRLPLAVALLLAVGLLSTTAAVAYQIGDERPFLPEVAPLEVDDPIGEAELQDLQTVERLPLGLWP